MNEDMIQQVAQQLGPQAIQRAVAQAMAEIDTTNLSADELQPLIAALEETLKNPDVYPQMVQAMIEAGVAEPDDFPPQFDPAFVVIMLITLYEVAKRLAGAGQGFARGGLAQAARAGRNGDTMLAHINPMEAAALRRMGGAGTINPRTGLIEFGFLKSVSKAVSGAVKGVTNAVKDVVKELGPAAPIIAAVVAPYAIPWLSGTLGVSSLAAGALYGAGTSALTGGNVLQGAVMGGLGAGLGDIVGGGANSLLGTSLSAGQQALLGNTLIGGALGAATGQGFGKGALGAATGTLLGQGVSGLAGSGAGSPLGAGLQSAGKTIGMMTTAGMPLKQALIGGALSGVISGGLKATQSPVDRLSDVRGNLDVQTAEIEKLLADPTVPEATKQAYIDYLNQTQLAKSGLTGYEEALAAPADSAQYQQAAEALTQPGATGAPQIYSDLGVAPPASSGLGATDVGLNWKTAGVTAAALSPLLLESLAQAQTPQQVEQTLAQNNPTYFNDLRIQAWDWDELSRRAAAANQSLGAYVANNWNNITAESAYTSPGGTTSNPVPVAMSRGGALSRMAYLAQGAGTGRSDTIDARLSDGEYVMDAETVAMLGDGSTRAGARKLEEMRSALRRHKGAALARGKISPNAKSPLSYIKEAA